MKAWFERNWFVLGLAGAVVLALLWPAPGARGGVLHSESTTRLAVVAIFFLQGLVLALEALREGLARWRLHVFVQVFGFVVIPLLGLLLDRVCGRWMPEELRLGFLFLAVLPTTVSSAIVFTSLAGGNTAGALVNATLSNLLGVVITPLWVGALLSVRGEAMPVLPLIREVALLILAPLLAGQIVRPLARRWIDPHKAGVGRVNSVLVLFIVYAAFCNSVHSGLWKSLGWGPLAWAAGGSVVFFALVLGAVIVGLRIVRLGPADRTAALFCAPQKTIAAGVPMAKLIFGAHPGLGLILLPLLLYHPLQLLVAGFLVSGLKAQNGERRA